MTDATRTVMDTGVRLLSICAVAALSLGLFAEFTEPVIIARKAREQQEVIDRFVTSGRAGERTAAAAGGAVRGYYLVSEAGRTVGVITELGAPGYSGDLTIMASYAPDGRILAAQLTDNLETPGLGKRAESAGYMEMFVGTGGDRPVPVSKKMLAAAGGPPAATAAPAGFLQWMFGGPAAAAGGADAVTGATITFDGVSSALAAGSAFVKSQVGR